MKKLKRADRRRLSNGAKYYVELAKTSNKAFLPLFFCDKRYLVLMGGGGSGKSIFAGRKILERVYTENGHNVLVLRKVARTLRESCFRQLVSQIQEHFDISAWKINKTEMSILSPNGSRIIFAGLDDAEKLKSIYGITMVWIEEASEISLSDFNQVDIRLRGKTAYYKQIILSFNPINVNHWLKKRFFDTKDPDSMVVKTTYKDNRFLDDEAKKVLENFRDTDEYYYNVYALGNWGTSGQSIFGSRIINSRLENIPPAVKTGEFGDDGVFVENDFGCVKIYEEYTHGEEYIVGADTAGEGEDYFASQVISVSSGKQVAVIRRKYDEDYFTHQCVHICRYYGGALLAFECNYSSYPVREALRMGYTNQYLRRNEDNIARSVISSYGFRTTSLTRPLILSNLTRIVKEDITKINDRDTLSEMLSFIRTDTGRIEADRGCHDDMVMALAIAYFVREDYLSLQSGEDTPRRKYNFAFEKEGYNDEKINIL